jgi:hypothetical protein
VLQRYGAYVALMRFTEVFDARGAFRAAPDKAHPQ